MKRTISLFGQESKIQYYDDIIGHKETKIEKTNEYANNILVLQPKFTTSANPLVQNNFNTKNYPIMIASINSSGDLLLTIMAKSLKSSSETMNWFGKVELFVSIA